MIYDDLVYYDINLKKVSDAKISIVIKENYEVR